MPGNKNSSSRVRRSSLSTTEAMQDHEVDTSCGPFSYSCCAAEAKIIVRETASSSSACASYILESVTNKPSPLSVTYSNSILSTDCPARDPCQGTAKEKESCDVGRKLRLMV